jgi:hypothetical protein
LLQQIVAADPVTGLLGERTRSCNRSRVRGHRRFFQESTSTFKGTEQSLHAAAQVGVVAQVWSRYAARWWTIRM